MTDATTKNAREPFPQAAPSISPQLDARIVRLPKVPRALAERLGYDAGLLLMTKLGGSQLVVPKGPPTSGTSVLVQALGEAAALVLIELFGGSTLEIPRGASLDAEAKRDAILRHPGSHDAAARAFNVTNRWVRMVRAAARKTATAAA